MIHLIILRKLFMKIIIIGGGGLLIHAIPNHIKFYPLCTFEICVNVF